MIDDNAPYLFDFFAITHFWTFFGEIGKNFPTFTFLTHSNSSNYLELFMKILLASELL